MVGERLSRVLASHVLCSDSASSKGVEEIAPVPCKVARPVAVKRDLHYRVVCTVRWRMGKQCGGKGRGLVH